MTRVAPGAAPRFRLRFLVLWLASVISAVLVLPYALSLQPGLLESLPVPLPIALLASVAQSAVLLALAVFAGLRAADAVGLRTPLTNALVGGGSVRDAFLALRPAPAAVIGGAVGIAILFLDAIVFAPLLPEFTQASATIGGSRLAGFLASFYGGIGEEILTRLFLVSVIAWILRGRAIWLAIIVAAVLFGAGHLPAAAAISPLTPLFVLRILLLNSIGGVVFGWIYWRRGLEAAMLAHFCADLVLHMVVAR